MKNAGGGSESAPEQTLLAGACCSAGRAAHRSWLACAQQVSVLAVKKLVVARTVKIAQEAAPPNVSAQTSPWRPCALLLYLLQLLCEWTRAHQCLQPSLQTDFTRYPTNHENVIYKQAINYPFAKKAESIRHPLGSLGQ